MQNLLNLLQNKSLLWHGSQQKISSASQPSEYPELDEKLHGGFPEYGVVDISGPQGIGELRLLLPFLKRQQQLLVFINPPGYLCAEQLHHYGVNIAQILLIFTDKTNDKLWAAEQCLKSGACAAVLLWQNTLETHHVKRLQVASETGDCLVFLLRPVYTNTLSLPVTLGLSLSANDYGLAITVRKRKGGWPLPTFSVDMGQSWPALTLHHPANVLHLPAARIV